MPHQAEDIWQNVVECQKDGLESILLNCKVNPRWENAELEQQFAKILRAREIVSKAIEPLRVDKKVGSSLEVAVYIKTSDELTNSVLKSNESDLCDIFITSQASVIDDAPQDVLHEYTEDEFTVWVVKAHGEKCERCWKYRSLVNIRDMKRFVQNVSKQFKGKVPCILFLQKKYAWLKLSYI